MFQHAGEGKEKDSRSEIRPFRISPSQLAVANALLPPTLRELRVWTNSGVPGETKRRVLDPSLKSTCGESRLSSLPPFLLLPRLSNRTFAHPHLLSFTLSDFCAIQIFGGSYPCLTCGRDFCLECFQLFPPSSVDLSSLTSPSGSTSNDEPAVAVNRPAKKKARLSEVLGVEVGDSEVGVLARLLKVSRGRGVVRLVS